MNWDQAGFRLDQNDGEFQQLKVAVDTLTQIYVPTTPPTVTGACAGNVALKNLIASLAAAGLVVDNTTP